ncbi:MAG TPA: hypothetical protein PK677_17635 [Acidiphilium sp.]|uniref:hypothetical protein n=1 Tax=Acidiphilium sp. TaxID=527 RepID=UPI00258C8767|nr:hypothetical protein [Acidiphilium sp.]HQT90326.1 hypothetical protein [Acidiphilium sp.]
MSIRVGMIEITQDMIGPADPVASIEEEYADALPRIGFLLEAFKHHVPSNDTPYGRMLYQLHWLDREIRSKRLPIPVNRGWIATLSYLVGSGEVSDTKQIETAMGELARILKGPGLLKPRHTPVVLAMLDDLIAAMHHYGDPLQRAEQDLVDELSSVAEGLRSLRIVPPIGGGLNLPPLEQKILAAKRFEAVFPPLTEKDDYITVNYHVSLPLFHGWCPYPVAKPPLPAPVPGLLKTPPDMTLAKNLIETKISR